MSDEDRLAEAPELMNFKEVMRYLDISESTLHRYLRHPSNPLPVIVLSHNLRRVRKDHLLGWLAGTFLDSNLEKDLRGGEE